VKKAFTMIELVFVIIIIGILAVIAIPKFSATRDDAIIAKAKTTVASIRSSLSSEVQRRVLSGNYTKIVNVGGSIGAYGEKIFDYFDNDVNGTRVLEYPPTSCANANSNGCWLKTADSDYEFRLPPSIGGKVEYKVEDNRFDCVSSDITKCRLLER